eukprot:CAMPEP_0178842710 /NCGR_PEP_ID=MMETSP0746-20121128/15689_1 /TAXON_ID=913974 /ORGANISM="Nitzschia punctata, Strain CCMP561" /LENGTH=65 /DNA_ID=CAMNT_0020506137 /DNA_START=117 /DNA_END=314 /DNA_ORIENTATION=-
MAATASDLENWNEGKEKNLKKAPRVAKCKLGKSSIKNILSFTPMPRPSENALQKAFHTIPSKTTS